MLCKHEDQSFISRTHINTCRWWHTFIILALGEAEIGGFLGSTCLNILAQSASPGSLGKMLSQETKVNDA